MKKKSTFSNRLVKILSLVVACMLIFSLVGCTDPFRMASLVEYEGSATLGGENYTVKLSFKEKRYVTLELDPAYKYLVKKNTSLGITLSKELTFQKVFGTYEGDPLAGGSEVKIGLALITDIRPDASIMVTMPNTPEGTISFNLIPWDSTTSVTLRKKTAGTTTPTTTEPTPTEPSTEPANP